MPEYLPKFKPGEAITLIATTAITGGQMVTVVGAVAGADSALWLGVASRDAAVGQPFGVYTDAVQRPIAATALSASQLIKCAANGQVAAWVPGTDPVERLVGIVIEGTTSAGGQIVAKFLR